MDRLSAIRVRLRRLVGGGWAFDRRDVPAAVTNAVANIPDGMASGVLAGVNPVYGLYTIMIGTPLAAALTSTQAMVFNTTSAMTLVAADGLGARTGDERVRALFVIALAAGAFQILLGVLGLGQLTRFVSNAVMTGFLTGIAVLIILGQLWDLTGYEGEGGSKLQQTVQLLGDLPEIDPATTAIGLGSLVLMLLLSRTRLANVNLLIALAIATAVAWLFGRLGWGEVALVSSLGEIPRSLPGFDLPELRLLPELVVAGIAVAMVGLLQAAGVAQRFPNPDGSDPDDSRDFFAQGVANVAGSAFQAMPGGGSLSGTTLNRAAGGRSRWAIIIQALVVVILVLAFSDLLSLIPMAALAALLIYSATLAIKLRAITTVARTTTTSRLTMLVTFLATLVIPLQQAVLLGVILAGILFLYRTGSDIRVRQLRRVDGQIVESDAPAVLPSDSVTVLDTHGSLFYAAARTLGERLPSARDAQRAVVVLRIRGHGDLGSTFLTVINKYAEQLQANGGKLLLAGVDPAIKERMTRTGHFATIGQDNVFVAESAIGVSSEAAFAAGEAWLTGAAGVPSGPAADDGGTDGGTDGTDGTTTGAR